MDKEYGLRLNRQAFLQSVGILFVLLLLAGGLTLLFPPGEFDRVLKEGVASVVPGTYHLMPGAEALPLWRWFTAPVEVLWSADGTLTIVILLFILLVGGAFAVFDASGLFQSLIDAFLRRWGNQRDAVIVVFATAFMLLGSIFGILEEVVPLIPVVVLVALKLGWDRNMGLGLILLPVGFGFSAALFNPFTIGVAQKLAGVPLFSGLDYRFLIFLVTEAVLLVFLLRYRRKLERAPGWIAPVPEVVQSPDTRGQLALAIGFGLLLVLMMVFPVIGLSDLSLPVIALGFLVLAFVTALRRGLKVGFVGKVFVGGMGGVAPGLVLILLAMGIKHIIATSHVMDTLLFRTAGLLEGQGPLPAAGAMYLVVFFLQFFIPSATAKAFLVMPLLTPLGDLVGVTRQTVVLAFNFGDGFSHLLYPTNPLLLIALSLANVGLGKWLKWTIGLQAILFVLTFVFLMLAAAFRYGPV
ncbi:MAG: hypothetical protein WCG80_17590 [Spirochaetales bacterium]